ncbi:uncharacterized protein KY384_004545 [Bacidia gigantensis]|uniref:uncharacterized protein n=1 Tax=Bacidia gigantensis TaxID=2732470 RepID=UPI001D058F46|nr:uncharacterized protein KY384_004545 [Bacidia gigantensis]KAG8531187.1 hypothetical protein KY384_004545 [Bacidia gigantensis]
MLSADEASEEALVNLYYNANERTLQWAERYLRENRAQDAADIVKEYSRGEAVDSNLSFFPSQQGKLEL